MGEETGMEEEDAIEIQIQSNDEGNEESNETVVID